MSPIVRRFAGHAIKNCGWLVILVIFLWWRPTTLEMVIMASLWLGLYIFVQLAKCFVAYLVAYRRTIIAMSDGCSERLSHGG